jgi:hypothetical protein
MKSILVLILISMIFVPGTALGWKSISSVYEKDCDFACNNSSFGIYNSTPMNFILIGGAVFVALGLYAKFRKTGLYETFSLNCKNCGKSTNGLKCPTCEITKQKAN